VAICFSGNAKTTTRLRIVEFGPDGVPFGAALLSSLLFNADFDDRNPHN
jgi:hypothetical protein